MHIETNEIKTIKKLKKDGSISADLISQIVRVLKNRELVLLPMDGIYAIVGVAGPEIGKCIMKAIGQKEKRFQRLISSFRMLDDLADITKSEYDFLNRIWPGEITVILRKKEGAPGETIALRYPRSKYLQEIIGRVDEPLIFSNLYRGFSRSPLYKKNDIINGFGDLVNLIIIVEELCRRHPRSSLIDISANSLKILRPGKVSFEEIKSLYFLGRDDNDEY